jgi:ABC-type dipeptide/oligopeptide/nickel transport system ATPase subunit
MRLIKPSGGEIRFNGRDVTTLEGSELRALRREMQIIFQDPFASLNPRHTVRGLIGEALVIHGLAKGRQDLTDQVVDLLETVGLQAAHLNRFAHEFSGGQRQRIGIARALAVRPKLVVCDEPVSALDVSVQAQVINLLEDLQEKFGLTYLFIAHDLSVVEHISNRVAVMYLGRVVEIASARAVGGADPRSQTEAPAHRAARRRAQPDQPANRLPFPHPLPDRRSPLQSGLPGTGSRAGRALGRLPPTSPVTGGRPCLNRGSRWRSARSCLAAVRMVRPGGCPRPICLLPPVLPPTPASPASSKPGGSTRCS